MLFSFLFLLYSGGWMICLSCCLLGVRVFARAIWRLNDVALVHNDWMTKRNTKILYIICASPTTRFSYSLITISFVHICAHPLWMYSCVSHQFVVFLHFIFRIVYSRAIMLLPNCTIFIMCDEKTADRNWSEIMLFFLFLSLWLR